MSRPFVKHGRKVVESIFGRGFFHKQISVLAGGVLRVEHVVCNRGGICRIVAGGNGMGVVPHGESIFSLFEHISAVFDFNALVIIRRHFPFGQRERQGVFFSLFEQFCLGKVAEFHGGLFNAALCIGRRKIELNDLFSGSGARVFHGYRGRIGIGVFRPVDALGKRRIAQTVSERIDDGGVVIDGAFLRGRLIPAIAEIDALFVTGGISLGGVVVRTAVRNVARADVGVTHGLARVGKSGVGGEVGGPEVGGTARGIDFPRENIAQCVEPRGPGAADPEDGVHAVVGL